MLSLNKNLIPHPLAILNFVEALFNFSVTTTDTFMNTDNRLYGKSSKDPSSDKPFTHYPIADREMEKKRENFLSDGEWNRERSIAEQRDQPVLKKYKQLRDSVDKEYIEVQEQHDGRIKQRTGWDPKGHLQDKGIPALKRNEVRDTNFLDDDKSQLGSIDERQDKGRLGNLSVTNKSSTSINTQQSDDTIKPEASGDKNSNSSEWADFIDSLF